MFHIKDNSHFYLFRNFMLIYVIIVFLTMGIDRENLLYYVHILASGVIIIFSLVKILIDSSLKKSSIYIGLIILSWLLIPVINTFSVISVDLHMKIIIIIILYTLSLIALFNKLLTSWQTFLYVFYYLNIVWVFINFTVFLFSVFGFYDFDITFSGIYYNRNIFSMTTVILMSIIWCFKKRYSIRFQKKINIIVLFEIILIVAALSLKGVIGLLIVFLLNHLLEKGFSMKTYFGVIMLVIACVCLITIDNPLYERIERFTLIFTNPNELRVNESAYGRMWLIMNSVDLIKNNFWWGIGINNSQFYLHHPFRSLDSGGGTYSHINYLEVLISGGIFSFLMHYIPQLYLLLAVSVRKNKTIFDNFILTILSCKIFWDFAFVSYYEYISLFILIMVYSIDMRREKWRLKT